MHDRADNGRINVIVLEPRKRPYVKNIVPDERRIKQLVVNDTLTGDIGYYNWRLGYVVSDKIDDNIYIAYERNYKGEANRSINMFGLKDYMDKSLLHSKYDNEIINGIIVVYCAEIIKGVISPLSIPDDKLKEYKKKFSYSDGGTKYLNDLCNNKCERKSYYNDDECIQRVLIERGKTLLNTVNEIAWVQVDKKTAMVRHPTGYIESCYNYASEIPFLKVFTLKDSIDLPENILPSPIFYEVIRLKSKLNTDAVNNVTTHLDTSRSITIDPSPFTEYLFTDNIGFILPDVIERLLNLGDTYT